MMEFAAQRRASMKLDEPDVGDYDSGNIGGNAAKVEAMKSLNE